MQLRLSEAGLVWRGDAEREPGFKAEIERGSLLSLRVVAGLLIVLPLLMLLARVSIIPVPVTDLPTALPNLIFAGLGTLALLTGWTRAGRRWARGITAAVIWFSVAAIIWCSVSLATRVEWVEHHLLGYILLVMVGAAAAVPFKPVHTLTLGLCIDVLYLVSLEIARERFGFEMAGFGRLQHLFTLIVTALCTALTASVYRQRYTGYLVHQEALRTSETLHRTQNKLLISENAAVMGRVAAGLSHELNSPIGVLASAVDTLAHLADKMGSAVPEERERLRPLLADVRRSGRESTERLRSIVGRMQRFTNLDRAEVQSADLNELIDDVVALIASRSEGASVVSDLQPLPRVVCRPQQLSAVFSNLIGNALEAVDGRGRVLINSRENGDQIEISIEDNGRGIAAEELATLFDPAAFRVSQGRVSAGHWSLFSCRQIVREHGGDIEVHSEGGKGTTVRVVLPSDSLLRRD
jgi:signal transduction histidine kinase